MKKQLTFVWMIGLSWFSSSLGYAQHIPVNNAYVAIGKPLYADCNQDGKLECLQNDQTASGWIDKDGNNVKSFPLDWSIWNSIIGNWNNDQVPDLFSQSEKKLIMSSGDSYMLIDMPYIEPVMADMNRDGLPDIFYYEQTDDWPVVKEPRILVQLPDGTFQKQALCVVTDSAEIRRSMFSTGGNGVYTSHAVHFSAVSGLEKGLPEASPKTQVVDMNLDGYPDLIDPKGMSFISLPDGRYYSASLAGKVTLCDVNEDGVKDLVIFDTTNKIVTLNLSNAQGSFDTSTLIENGSITNIYCQDLDGDGKCDILLQADSKSANSYAYLVFFKNNGNGKFKKTERAMKGVYAFSEPYEINHNGIPTIVVKMSSDNGDIFKRIDWNSSFKLSETDLCQTGFKPCYYSSMDLPMVLLPFMGDGNNYVLADSLNSEGSSVGKLLYSLSPTHTNTAPEKMAMPNVIYDKSNGVIKVEWSEGHDNETASCDLTYEVNIASDAQTVFHGQMGTNMYLIKNVGTWPKSLLRIKVRATDKGGLKGPWSEAATFTNTSTDIQYFISNANMTLADTLVVKALSATGLTFKAAPDGEVIETDGNMAKIIFREMGDKLITVTAADGTSAVQRTYVRPFKKGAYTQFPVFDLNQDGQVESYYDRISCYENDAWEICPGMSLSDVNTTGNSSFMFDKNMDGLADIYGITKNSTKHPWLINKGDLDFETNDDACTFDGTQSINFMDAYTYKVDLDNDGLMDVANQNYIYQNTGNQVYQLKKSFTNPQNRYVDYVADFNKDGLVDLLVHYTKNGKRVYEIGFNQGNFNFTFMSLPDELQFTSVADVNNDGYPDIWYENSLEDNNYIAYLGSPTLTFKETITLPGMPLDVDIDNDGRMDYQTYDNGYYYILLNTSTELVQTDYEGSYFYQYASEINRPDLFDINHDGMVDIGDGHENTLILSKIGNNAPQAPAWLNVNQSPSEVTLNWGDASDAETPLAKLRYNVSIQEKGAEGDNAFIISPLNAGSDVAATANPRINSQYRSATTRQIPFSRFIAGKTYQVKVQTIDSWNEHSPFSQIVEFTPVAKVFATMPAKGGVDVPVTFQYADNTTGTPIIDADGGTISDHTITWSTSGKKTVKFTSAGATSTCEVMIVAQPDLQLQVPKKVLSGSYLQLSLPEAFSRIEGNATLTADNDDVMITMDEVSQQAAVLLPEPNGTVRLTATYTDDVFGTIKQDYDIQLVGEGFTASISKVSVTDGHNVIHWDADMTLPDASLFTGTLNIWKESNIANVFEMIATVPFADGQYIDLDSKPNVMVNRYFITLNTVNTGETSSSTIHGNIHIMVNQGIGNDINLHWMPYEGADIAQYTILAGTSPDQLKPIETLSGNARSYTHKRANDATTYYRVEYTFKSDIAKTAAAKTVAGTCATAAQKADIASSVIDGMSNVISTEEAYNVTMVNGITVSTVEGTTALTATDQQLHLQATITPLLATIAQVEWSIITGSDLATITSDGEISLKENKTGGTVTVQAQATDGSGITATLNISASAYATGISATITGSTPSVTVQGSKVSIGNISTSTDVMITSLNGTVMYRAELHTPTSITTLSPGFYIVKAGKTIQPIYLK